MFVFMVMTKVILFMVVQEMIINGKGGEGIEMTIYMVRR